VAWVDVGGVEHRFGCDTEGNRYAVNDEEYLTFNRMEYVNQDNQSVYANIRYDNTSNTHDNASDTNDSTNNTHDNIEIHMIMYSNTHGNSSNTNDSTIILHMIIPVIHLLSISALHLFLLFHCLFLSFTIQTTRYISLKSALIYKNLMSFTLESQYISDLRVSIFQT